MRILIVGYGMAGARLAGELRGAAAVTVLGGETHRPYNRILLANLLAGKVQEPDVALVDPAGRGVRVHLGVPAAAIDRAERTVSTSDGRALRYDRLVLATGSRPILPPVKGLVTDDGELAPGVVAFRTLDDCRRILALARPGGRALVLGGGLLGLEAARGLAGRGLAVTVLHAGGHLMDRQLDPAAGAILASTLDSLGVAAESDVSTVEVARVAGRLAVRLADDRILPADLLVVACGVRPETALAERAGLLVERGIVVDDRLRTSDPRVYAIGDCAQHAGEVGGLLAPAWAQAAVLAGVLTGRSPLARYRPPPLLTRLKAAGIDLAAMGDSAGPGGGHPLTFTDPAGGTYAKLVVRDGRLAGAILLGDNPSVGTVIQLFDRAAPLPADLRGLLLGRTGAEAPAPATDSPARMPDAATVCQCNNVTKGALLHAWRSGARSVAEVVAQTRATTGCGSCRDAVCGLVQWMSTVDSEAAA